MARDFRMGFALFFIDDADAAFSFIFYPFRVYNAATRLPLRVFEFLRTLRCYRKQNVSVFTPILDLESAPQYLLPLKPCYSLKTQ